MTKTHYKQRVTSERLRELLSYDPGTGLFVWRQKRGRARLGALAGTIDSDGYINIGIDGILYKAHRLAWLYESGEWPRSELDHINREKADNRLSNLRETTSAENKQNTKLRKSNTSGFKGVHFCKAAGRWQARIRLKGKRQSLGLFDNPEAASAAYEAAAAAMHTHRPGILHD